MSRNSNERFLRKQLISTKTTSHKCLVKCACVALIGFHGKDEKHARGLREWRFCSERKEKEFRNEKLSYLWTKLNFIIHFMWNWGITLSTAVFAYHNPSARLIASLTESVKRAQTVFGHLKATMKARENEPHSNAKVLGRYFFINNEKYNYKNIPSYLKYIFSTFPSFVMWWPPYVNFHSMTNELIQAINYQSRWDSNQYWTIFMCSICHFFACILRLV